MQAMMHKKEHKKERSNVIFCPRCHAGNLTAQIVCGKCGYVFPKDKVTFKGRKGEEGEIPPVPPSLPGAPKEGMKQEEGGEGDEEGTPQEPPKPQRPKTLPEKGATEGISKEAGSSLSCPRCGMDARADVKRCPHCGYKR